MINSKFYKIAILSYYYGNSKAIESKFGQKESDGKLDDPSIF